LHSQNDSYSDIMLLTYLLVNVIYFLILLSLKQQGYSRIITGFLVGGTSKYTALTL